MALAQSHSSHQEGAAARQGSLLNGSPESAVQLPGMLKASVDQVGTGSAQLPSSPDSVRVSGSELLSALAERAFSKLIASHTAHGEKLPAGELTTGAIAFIQAEVLGPYMRIIEEQRRFSNILDQRKPGGMGMISEGTLTDEYEATEKLRKTLKRELAAALAKSDEVSFAA